MRSSAAESPGTYHLYERDKGTVTELFTTRPELKSYRLAPMHSQVVRARDGLELVSYLTLPDGEELKPKSPLPMVLLVHGGPWARDGYGYNSHHQWLANRGYAVLSVNFRGSVGFGKALPVNAGDLDAGCKMHYDSAGRGGMGDRAGHRGSEPHCNRRRSPRGSCHVGGTLRSCCRRLLRGGHRRPIEPGDALGDSADLIGQPLLLALARRVGDTGVRSRGRPRAAAGSGPRRGFR